MKKLLAVLSVIIFVMPSISYGYNEDAIIRGISRFMMKRAQAIMLEKYLRRIENEKYMKTYFPKTLEFLKNTNFLLWTSGVGLENAIKNDMDNIINPLLETLTDEKQKNIGELFYIGTQDNVDRGAVEWTKVLGLLQRLKVDSKNTRILQRNNPAFGVLDEMIKGIQDIIEKEECTEKKKAKLNKQINLLKGIKGILDEYQKDAISYVVLIDNFLTVISSIELKDGGYINTINIKRYAMFFAQLADAKSADEVTAVLEATVLDQSSYHARRETHFSIFLSAYLGGAFGYEAGTVRASWGVNYAVLFAPIGLDVNMGLGGHSLSMFLSPFDFANAINADLWDDTQKLTIKKIVTPGAFLVYGMKNEPLAFGIGVQHGQQIRGHVEGDRPERELRLLAFAAFDMPLFRLH